MFYTKAEREKVRKMWNEFSCQHPCCKCFGRFDKMFMEPEIEKDGYNAPYLKYYCVNCFEKVEKKKK